MTQLVLLTGGTGTLGRLVAPRLLSAGYEVRVLTRTMREPDEGVEYAVGDLATGPRLDKAMTDIETIIHCAGSAKGDEVKPTIWWRAPCEWGSPHVVYISVVGADRVPVRSGLDRAAFGYYAAKRAAERVIADSALPWTTLR
ncbi:MAG: SDR family oxidoreductase, partial [Pseudonocardia sp.]|nr:SDR family oxidoreductase [Pseudonocardia sp.]